MCVGVMRCVSRIQSNQIHSGIPPFLSWKSWFSWSSIDHIHFCANVQSPPPPLMLKVTMAGLPLRRRVSPWTPQAAADAGRSSTRRSPHVVSSIIVIVKWVKCKEDKGMASPIIFKKISKPSIEICWFKQIINSKKIVLPPTFGFRN